MFNEFRNVILSTSRPIVVKRIEVHQFTTATNSFPKLNQLRKPLWALHVYYLLHPSSRSHHHINFAIFLALRLCSARISRAALCLCRGTRNSNAKRIPASLLRAAVQLSHARQWDPLHQPPSLPRCCSPFLRARASYSFCFFLAPLQRVRYYVSLLGLNRARQRPLLGYADYRVTCTPLYVYTVCAHEHTSEWTWCS